MRLETVFLAASLGLLAMGCSSAPVARPAPTLALESPKPVGRAIPTPVVLYELAANFERVHFPTDSAMLDRTARALLRRNALILRDNPEVRVIVEGHADERWTREYNFRLGQERAEAVVGYLTSMGVDPTQVELVSFGESAPLLEGSGPVVWSVNRRAEFRVVWDPSGNVSGSLDDPVERPDLPEMDPPVWRGLLEAEEEIETVPPVEVEPTPGL